MALIADGRQVDDRFVTMDDGEPLPPGTPVIVSLARWQADRGDLLDRGVPVGVRLQSDQQPAAIAGDLDTLAVVALEFPVFRDGRAYSSARLLRERHGYTGEIRAVGEVLLEQLHYMQRVGFNAFEIDSETAQHDYDTAMADFSVWYQPSADGRPTAVALRHAGSG